MVLEDIYHFWHRTVVKRLLSDHRLDRNPINIYVGNWINFKYEIEQTWHGKKKTSYLQFSVFPSVRWVSVTKVTTNLSN